MSFERDILIGLRIEGPCSIAVLAKALKLSWDQTYAGVFRLRTKNLACRYGHAKYDVTKRGRTEFNSLIYIEKSKGILPLWKQQSDRNQSIE